MPQVTGGDFWLYLAQCNPPLVDASMSEVYDCSVTPGAGGLRDCEYRGPHRNVNWPQWPDEDPVGADRAGNHRDGGNVLLRSGDVRSVGAEHPLWARAAVTTTGD